MRETMVYYYGFLLLRWMATALFLLREGNKYCVLGAEMVPLLYLSKTVPHLEAVAMTSPGLELYLDTSRSTPALVVLAMQHSIWLVSSNGMRMVSICLLGIVPASVLVHLVFGLESVPAVVIHFVWVRLLQQATYEHLQCEREILPQ